jgi:hypothetical protein
MKKNYLFTLVLMLTAQVFWSQITVSTVSTFSSCAGSPSASQIITVNDPLPGGNLTVTAPTGFEVKTGSGNYATSITISGTGGLNTIPSTQIHIRLKSNATGSPSGNVTFTGTLRITRNMPVVGTVSTLPATPSITASGTTTLCNGGSVILTSTSLAGNVWSTGATTQSITVTTAGSYSVSVLNNGCSSVSSAATNVVVNPLPSIPTITPDGPTTFCLGDNVVLSTIDPTSRNSGSLSYMWSSGETSTSISVSDPGTYSVVAIDENGCKSRASLGTEVTVNPLATTPIITVGGSSSFCVGGNVTLTSTPASSYKWSTGETTQSIVVSTSGLYSVMVNNGTCNSVSSIGRRVIINPLPSTPTITANGSTSFCAGKSVVLTSSSATGNLWSNGSNAQSITVAASGTYTVAVTKLGCTSQRSSETIVTVSPSLAKPTITASGSTTLCTGGSVTLTSSSQTGNLWSNGETTPSITINRAGTYSVTSTNEEGCKSSPSLAKTVIVNTVPPSPTISVIGSTSLNVGGSVLLTSSYASSNTWSTGARTRSITVKTPGVYTVSFSSATCTSAPSESVRVTQNSYVD